MPAYPPQSREARMPEAADNNNKAHDRTDEIRSTRAPTLREDQIQVLSRYGQTRNTEVEEVLLRAGDTSNNFIIILEGEVEVIDAFAGEARTLGVFHAGRFLGELNMFTGQAMYCSAVVRQGGEVLAIPREACVYDEDRPGPEDNRLASLERCDASEGVRGPQPSAPPLDRA
jgi:hypothetical protein